MTWQRQLVLVVCIGLLAGALRFPTAGSFTTVDEENWMFRGQTFWHKLFYEHDVAATFVTSHPGATMNWAVGAGVAWQEHRLGQEMTETNVDHFRRYATAPVVIVVTLLIMAITWLVISILGSLSGTVAGVLLASEPYLVGMGQVAHVDAFLGLFMLAALLSGVQLHRTKERRWLIITGVLWGWALATKFVLGFWLLPFFAWPLVLSVVRSKLRGDWRQHLTTLVLLIVIALVVFVITWPAALTVPDFQLGYIARDTNNVLTQEHVALAEGSDPIAPWTFYLRSLLGRTSPLLLVLVILASILAVWRKELPERRMLVVLLLYTVGFVIGISLAAKKADRYMIPALVAFPLLAGWAVAALQVLWREITVNSRWQRWFGAVAVIGITSVTVTTSLAWLPYAITYSNPLFPGIRPISQQGWGEGIDIAAAWLNELPNATEIRIASWYPSVTRSHFNGATTSLSSLDDYRVTYAITYRNMYGRAGDTQASNVLDFFAGQEPVYTVRIRGVEYAWVYKLDNVGEYTKIPGELTSGGELGQTVTPTVDHFEYFDLGFATYGDRANTEPVLVHIRTDVNATDDLRTIRIAPQDIKDNKWHRVSFLPLDVTGTTFFIAIDSPTASPGNAVTVRYTDHDIRPGQLFVRRTVRDPAANQTSFLKDGDLAIRLPGEQ